MSQKCAMLVIPRRAYSAVIERQYCAPRLPALPLTAQNPTNVTCEVLVNQRQHRTTTGCSTSAIVSRLACWRRVPMPIRAMLQSPIYLLPDRGAALFHSAWLGCNRQASLWLSGWASAAGDLTEYGRGLRVFAVVQEPTGLFSSVRQKALDCFSQEPRLAWGRNLSLKTVHFGTTRFASKKICWVSCVRIPNFLASPN